MSAFWGLVSLFWSSFLSATLLPGSSEVLLVSLLVAKVTGAVPLIVVATIGNTLGGMTNLVLGRILPQPKPRTGTLTALRWLQRYGPAALLLSWVPVIGDVLCVAAGWLRMPWLYSTLFICIGKALRYIVVAIVALQGMTLWS
ncbi:YqaA family protein [Symbiopectobacterium purcellii]|uniref:YqaA family protein n=1 Tax=Symbiopectobacterium purcellii TaxID=2871826 RepID=UPI003F82F003